MKKIVDNSEIVGQYLKNVYVIRNKVLFVFDIDTLFISLDPSNSYVYVGNKISSEFEKSSFAEFIRSRMRGGRVLEFKTLGYERTAVMKISKIDELGTKHLFEIYIDIMGKHSNLIIVENGKILEAFRRIENRYRKIFPGEDFIAFTSDKKSPEEMTLEDFENMLNSNESLEKAIYSSIEGFSKVTAHELIKRVEDLKGSVSPRALLESLKTLLEEYKNSGVYIFYENDFPIDISAFNIHIYKDSKHCREIKKCTDEFFEKKEERNKFIQKKDNLKNIVKKFIDEKESLLEKLSTEIEEAKDYEKYRKYGELLKAYFYQVPYGAKEVTLVDWETGEEITIPLETSLNAIENSTKYFSIYTRKKKKLEGLQERIKILRNELEYLHQLFESLELAEDLDDLKDIEEEMIEEGLIKKKGIQSQKELSKPKKYIYNGFTIYVGKNNRQNDMLVKSASDKDIWLHPQGIPGAHVIIKTNGRPVDEDTLKFAAKICAKNSRARYSTNVPVDYTYIKNVRKVKGLKPGMVLYYDFKTIFVNPNED